MIADPRSAPVGSPLAGATSRVPACRTSSAAAVPQATTTAASPAKVVRQPKASLQAWKRGVAIIAPIG